MFQILNVSKHYGDALLFAGVNLVIHAGERIGVVGPNGCGKTTLLRIMIGEETPDTGSVQPLVPALRVGYLPQALTYREGATVREVLTGSQYAEEEHWVAQVQLLAERMATASGEALERVAQQYAAAVDCLAQMAIRLPDHEIARILAALGLSALQMTTPVRILSGGQKTRLSLARVLLQNPSLLLLDEPTNHLDIVALEWLEGYLRQYEGALVVVSHDRTFLDRTVNAILEMDPQRHAVTLYPGTYSDYTRVKDRERAKHWQSYQEQQERIARLQGAVRQLKGQAKRIELETIDFHYRKIAKKVARQAMVRQRRLERLLASEDYVEKPPLSWEIKPDFVNTPASGQDVLICEGLSKRFGARVLFEGVDLILRRGERIALVGPNGSGKTTLLRIIVGQEAPSAGSVRLGANVQLGYFAQEQETLDGAISPLETVRRCAALSETDARNFLHYFLFAGDDVFVPVGSLSYGERARLALGMLVLKGCNLLLLDEPINHLDIPSRERFEWALSTYEGTVLAVVHDRYFIARFATGLWAIEAQGIRRYVDLEDLQRGRGERA